MPIVKRDESTTPIPEPVIQGAAKKIEKAVSERPGLDERIVRQGCVQAAGQFPFIMAFCTSLQECEDKTFELAKKMEDYVWKRGKYVA